MPHHRLCQGDDVLARRGQPPVQQCARLRGEHQRLAGARTGAPAHVLADFIGHAVAGPAGAHQLRDPAQQVVADVHVADMLLQCQHRFALHHPRHVAAGAAGGLRQDVVLFLLGGIVDADVQQEAVQLGFRQRVGAGLLQRVLRGQHEERRGQCVGGAGVADGAFLHGFQQRGLGLGRRAVELVGQQQVGEDRARLEAEMAVPGAVVLLEQLGAQDVAGHQVRRELHATELQVQGLPQRAHQQRLAQTGHALQQAVAARQQADQQLFHHVLLADDRLADGGAEFAQLGELLLEVGFGERRHGVSRKMCRSKGVGDHVVSA